MDLNFANNDLQIREILAHDIIPLHMKDDKYQKMQKKGSVVKDENLLNKNRLFYGDNLEVLTILSRISDVRGHIKLIYIDPPFATKQKFQDRQLRVVYTDNLDGKDYLNFLRPRLQLLRELLSVDGSLFLHCDWHMSHYVKILCDQVFGRKNFRNEIVVRRGRKKNLQKQFSKVHRLHIDHDVIFWYSRDPTTKYPPLFKSQSAEAKWMGFWSNVNRPTMRYPLLGVTPDRGQWKWKQERASKAVENYKKYKVSGTSRNLTQYWMQTGSKKEFIRKKPSRKYPEYWIAPQNTTLVGTNWTDISSYSYSSQFPTEKHGALLERIIQNYSAPQDLILDCFGGSGTVAVVCEKLDRKWILADNSPLAITTTISRLNELEKEKSVKSKSDSTGKNAIPNKKIWALNYLE